MPDPVAWYQAAARLDSAAGRLADALADVTIGPSDWRGDAAARFQSELDHQRAQLAGVAAALRRQAVLLRTEANQLTGVP